MRAVAVSRSAKHLRATPRNSVPYAVGATWRVVRSNRRNPSCVSNSRIRTLRPDGVMNRASAAREKFRCCATRRKARSCREVNSIINQNSSIIELFELVSQSALELNSHNVTGVSEMGTFFSDVACKPDMAAAALQRDDGSALAARLTPVQWLICGITCLGFAFDLYETLMTALIVRPVLSTLGNLRSGTPEFNLWVGLFFFLPGVAGGLFGLLGGYLTDLLGRRRVLVWSILLYAFSACAAGFATSLPLLLFLRCTTWIGTCVEQVAAIAWLAELFANPKQRQSVLGYTQVAFGFGGMMVTAAYYLAVTYGEHFPAIYGAHEPWRYTLLSGLIPAIPLVLVRPFLPESPIWGAMKARGTLKRTSVKELFRPALRKTTLWVTLMMACSFALPFGALQHTPRIIPGLVSAQKLAPRQVEQTVSRVYMVQELGSLAGRLAFAFVVVYFVKQRKL